MKTVTISALIVFVDKYQSVALSSISNMSLNGKLRIARQIVGAYRAFMAKQTAFAARTLLHLQSDFVKIWKTEVVLSA